MYKYTSQGRKPVIPLVKNISILLYFDILKERKI